MTTDSIAEIGVDELERLYVKPTKASFPYLYREAMEVHWDESKGLLWTSKPHEWSYFDWYRQIIKAVSQEQIYSLSITQETRWVNIPDELRVKIQDWPDSKG